MVGARTYHSYNLASETRSLSVALLIGVLLAVLYKAFARTPASLSDMLAITATNASHFLLKWPSHRHGKSGWFQTEAGNPRGVLTRRHENHPGDSAAYGASLFEHLLATFAAENVIFLAGLWVYTTSPPAACTAGVQRRPSLLKVVSAVVVAQQAQFCSTS